MSYLNEISAAVALILMALVLRGLGPYVRFRCDMTKYDLMRMAVFMVSGLTGVRILWWDLLRPLAGEVGVIPATAYSLWGQMVNTGFNIWAAAAALTALAALHRSLPVSQRPHYNWLTTPFYPGRLFNRRND